MAVEVVSLYFFRAGWNFFTNVTQVRGVSAATNVKVTVAQPQCVQAVYESLEHRFCRCILSAPRFQTCSTDLTCAHHVLGLLALIRNGLKSNGLYDRQARESNTRHATDLPHDVRQSPLECFCLTNGFLENNETCRHNTLDLPRFDVARHA